jgi:hypothetical protein
MYTIFYLRTRFSDDDEWMNPEGFVSRKMRNDAAAHDRIIGGLRTHSYEEKVTKEQYEKWLDEQKNAIRI